MRMSLLFGTCASYSAPGTIYLTLASAIFRIQMFKQARLGELALDVRVALDLASCSSTQAVFENKPVCHIRTDA